MSLEGAVAWAMLSEGGGQWRRAGIDGTIVGLDLAGCLQRPSASSADAGALEFLLLAGEAGALAAMRRATDAATAPDTP